MAGDQVRSKTKSKHAVTPHETARSKTLPKHTEDHGATAEPRPTLDELRESRVKYFSRPASERQRSMQYVYDKRLPANPPTVEVKHKKLSNSIWPGARRTERFRQKTRKHRRHSKPENGKRKASDDDRVYAVRERNSENSEQEREVSRSEVDDRIETQNQPSVPVKRKRRRTTPQRRHTTPTELAGSDEHQKCTDDGGRPQTPRGSSAVATNMDNSRPALKRSATTPAPQTEVSVAKSTASFRTEKKPSSVFFNLFQTMASSPERRISCLTCGDDEIPVSRSAKLPCKHRMCHSCLRRVFKMSITDPAHMPPRCCTDDHIDLKHVDKLFNQDFKKTWNRKFDEYKTRNRVYCIGRRCGEWIKPNHITIEHGRRIGKCKHCGTRVCALCNNKAHSSRDCPEDPATKKFIDTAKAKGWQTCFNCSAMVELKEGCNHMTCRCMAEFCMVCGLKWKSCDCPWFNYEAAEAHLGNPIRYQEEMERRREQQRRDETLARRMEFLGIFEHGGGGFFGLGNAAGQHANQNFIQQAQEALTLNYQNAEQAARGLFNAWYTGRENQLPDIAEDVTDVPQTPRRQQDQLRLEDDDAAEPGVTPERRRRHNTTRRRHHPPDPAEAFENDRDQPREEDGEHDRRIREWAEGVEDS